MQILTSWCMFFTLSVVTSSLFLFFRNLIVWKRDAEDTLNNVLSGKFDLLQPVEVTFDPYDERFACYTKAVMRHADKFQKEFVPFQDISNLPDYPYVSIEDGRWQFFNLERYKNIFPRASDFFQRWKDYYGLTDNIYSLEFWRLNAGTYLPSHHGPSNLKVTMQIPIYIPNVTHEESECLGIYFGKEARDDHSRKLESQKGILYHWEMGKFFFFNDAHRHSAWNFLEEDRSIIMLNIRNPLSWWRPDHTKCPHQIPGQHKCA